MAHSLYQNIAIKAKLEDLYTTKMDLNPFITTDYTLTAQAGDKIQINAYTATGDVQDLAMGVGNSTNIEVSYTPNTYTVGVTQGRLQYYDEQVNKDPKVIDVGVAGVVAKMTNNITGKIITEFGNATLTSSFATPGFDAVVDGLSVLNLEDNSGLFILMNVKTANAFKKALNDDLKYVEAFVRTGYIGHVAGIPIYVTKACPNDKFFIAHREAVTNFVKRGTEIEYDRNPNTRLNEYFMRKTQVIALTDATKVVTCSSTASL